MGKKVVGNGRIISIRKKKGETKEKKKGGIAGCEKRMRAKMSPSLYSVATGEQHGEEGLSKYVCGRGEKRGGHTRNYERLQAKEILSTR